MADAYWKYGNGRQPPAALPPHAVKRPRIDYEMPGGAGMPTHYARGIVDTGSINASYDRYLSNAISTYGGESGRSMGGGLGVHHPVDGPSVIGMGASDQLAAGKGRPVGVGGRPEIHLPPDASSTLFVEGLPANCTRREVSHIFRPFVGYKEVRLVTKESRHSSGDPLVLCFVEFQSPAHAATAMDALQGYKFDEHDRGSAILRLQFSRFPGARSGGGHRGKR